jgi:catechol 2,3-dioxygenase-like lactoylglutathione lyase family enzyme
MPRLDSVLETAIYVDDVERARRFYEDALELKPVFSDSRLTAYDAGGRSILLVFRRGGSANAAALPGGTIPGHDGAGPAHVAFAIAADQLAAWEARLTAHATPIEGRVEWPRGGTSIYFRDPEGHLLEFATPGLWPSY